MEWLTQTLQRLCVGVKEQYKSILGACLTITLLTESACAWAVNIWVLSVSLIVCVSRILCCCYTFALDNNINTRYSIRKTHSNREKARLTHTDTNTRTRPNKTLRQLEAVKSKKYTNLHIGDTPALLLHLQLKPNGRLCTFFSRYFILLASSSTPSHTKLCELFSAECISVFASILLNDDDDDKKKRKGEREEKKKNNQQTNLIEITVSSVCECVLFCVSRWHFASTKLVKFPGYIFRRDQSFKARYCEKKNY